MAVGSPSSSTHSLTPLGPTLTGPTQHRPAPLDTSKFTTESPRPTPRDLYSLFPPNQGQTDDDVLLTIRPLWKRRLHELLEQPASSSAAFAVHMVSTALIVLSAVITVLETVPTFHRVSNRVWFGMETGLVVVFTVEYVARVVCWSFSWSSLFRWVLSFYGIIDLLSVLPYYIELMLGQDTSVLFRFSILRMFRLLRVFRPFRYNHTILLTIEVMYLSVRRSQHSLLAIGFFVVMILTVFSTLLYAISPSCCSRIATERVCNRYFAERGTWDEVMDTFINSDGDPTQFASIPAAAWFVIVTQPRLGLRWMRRPLRPRTTHPHLEPIASLSRHTDTPTDRPTLPPAPTIDRHPAQRNPDPELDPQPRPPPRPITTVGYGEITPRSFLGRLITLPILVFGLLLITLPSFVLGREFSLVWTQMTEDKGAHRAHPDKSAWQTRDGN
ncbi:hypothetical protein D9611_008440 [Ephemerocybe angulata]|uniref:Ion transport domain-containing protein n=1 Tax=Ephemerocybe angulata TaxID=980116 RepID=A0A8H5BJ35_9AGAR|nr:hypothetical protein D9611_008440 [Tulosesus angulatus]